MGGLYSSTDDVVSAAGWMRIIGSDNNMGIIPVKKIGVVVDVAGTLQKLLIEIRKNKKYFKAIFSLFFFSLLIKLNWSFFRLI